MLAFDRPDHANIAPSDHLDIAPSDPGAVASLPDPATDVRRLIQEGRVEEARLALVSATKDSVYRFLNHMLRNDSTVEDIFQDSYLRAFRALSLFRGESSLTTWMLSIARNTALNRVRRQRTERTWQVDVEAPPDMADPGAAAETLALEARARSDRRLLAAMDSLSPAQREAVLLFYIEDRPIDEVARITRRTPNTIKSDLRRARLVLRSILDDNSNGGSS